MVAFGLLFVCRFSAFGFLPGAGGAFDTGAPSERLVGNSGWCIADDLFGWPEKGAKATKTSLILRLPCILAATVSGKLLQNPEAGLTQQPHGERTR
jgi:hypothetical protein